MDQLDDLKDMTKKAVRNAEKALQEAGMSKKKTNSKIDERVIETILKERFTDERLTGSKYDVKGFTKDNDKLANLHEQNIVIENFDKRLNIEDSDRALIIKDNQQKSESQNFGGDSKVNLQSLVHNNLSYNNLLYTASFQNSEANISGKQLSAKQLANLRSSGSMKLTENADISSLFNLQKEKTGSQNTIEGFGQMTEDEFKTLMYNYGMDGPDYKKYLDQEEAYTKKYRMDSLMREIINEDEQSKKNSTKKLLIENDSPQKMVNIDY